MHNQFALFHPRWPMLACIISMIVVDVLIIVIIFFLVISQQFIQIKKIHEQESILKNAYESSHKTNESTNNLDQKYKYLLEKKNIKNRRYAFYSQEEVMQYINQIARASRVLIDNNRFVEVGGTKAGFLKSVHFIAHSPYKQFIVFLNSLAASPKIIELHSFVSTRLRKEHQFDCIFNVLQLKKIRNVNA